ncbi:MAG TPA: glycosyltransferase [Myxococcales bacterium]|nr:glycosyltransferase [Myxococcales bacterium]HIK84994.1 glycosyltransferase [Myxococcales bacterium]
MTISVVIPTLDEASRIVRAIESVIAPGVEVIVVDGGSRDETCRLARDAGARVLVSSRGRARQLRMGGEESSGSIVLFLHADTDLESEWQEGVRAALSDPACAGGAFAFRFAERGVRERLIERSVALRLAFFRLPYGDQALFVRRSVLEQMGGMPIVPMMEDLDLVRGIKRAGRLQLLPLTATTSSRRYADRGSVRTVLEHQVALLGWWLGWDRAAMAKRMGR